MWRWLTKRRAAPVAGPLSSGGTGFTGLLRQGSELELRPIRGRRQALEAYAGWVAAAAGALAQDVRAAPWDLWQRSGRKQHWRRLDETEIPPLLCRPNALQTWGDLLELTQLHLDLTGEAFWHLVTEQDGRGRARVTGLQILYPQWIEGPVLDRAGLELAGWCLQVPGRAPQTLPARDVIFLRYPHPAEPLRGASPVEALALSHELDQQARAYAGALLRNRATPELVITSAEELTSEQADLIRERWLDRYRDPASGPAVLGRGGQVQQLGGQLKDLAFLELAQLSRDQVFAVYKLPASKVGLTTDTNRANAEAADATYKENAVLPRLRRIEEAINHALLPRLAEAAEGPAEGGRLWFEFESPVREDREHLLRRAGELLANGAITLDRYRELLGEDPGAARGETGVSES
ncbi:phage portal protein [Fodinicurvata sediminis]|uniref:phage portal protein n=1 Tax=Fodinicurvata sediminis TaxID=1121832 RepID=UPI0003B3EF7F|nr:phage portal protein [Fodinicurvata sediminis]